MMKNLISVLKITSILINGRSYLASRFCFQVCHWHFFKTQIDSVRNLFPCSSHIKLRCCSRKKNRNYRKNIKRACARIISNFAVGLMVCVKNNWRNVQRWSQWRVGEVFLIYGNNVHSLELAAVFMAWSTIKNLEINVANKAGIWKKWEKKDMRK